MPTFASKLDLKKEIYRCGSNPIYFINNHIKIQDPTAGAAVLFKTYDFQDQLVMDFHEFRRNIVAKARQMGISTIVAAYIVWLMLFKRDQQIAVIAIRFDTAKNILKKVKYAFKNLPKFFQELAKIKFSNKTSLILTNGSEIKAFPSTEDAVRSEALSLLVIDEAAHIEGIDVIWGAAKPTLAKTGGKVIAVSSPNGVGNWFHEIWEGSQGTEGNGWKGTILPWDRHPDRDMNWFIEETKDFSPRYIAQEYEVSFLASGETVISGDRLLELRKNSKQPLLRIGVEQNLWIFKRVEKNRTYIIPVDVARGDGEDYSAFHVLDVSTMEQVAEFQAKIDSDDFARLLQDVGMEYNEALIIPENAQVGHEVAKKLWKAGYKNVYWSKKGSHEYIPQYQAQTMTDKCVLGFTTSPLTRPWIINKMEEFVRLNVVKINSIRTATELQYFIWKNGKAEAQKGKNDDLVLALAIGCWVRDTVIVEKVNTLSFKRTLLMNIKKNTNTLSTLISGQIGYKKPDKMKQMQEEHLKAQKKKSYLGMIFKV